MKVLSFTKKIQLFSKIDFEKDKWYASRKMDGLRNLSPIDATGNATCYSRSGNEFLTLDHVKESLKKLNVKDSLGKNFNEPYISKLSNIKFIIFYFKYVVLLTTFPYSKFYI